MTAAINDWAPRVGVERAGRAFGLSSRTWRHRRQAAEGRLPPRPSRAGPSGPREVAWKIPDEERDKIRALLCEPRFVDLAPAQVYAGLLDEGTYVCSERTMYRILEEADLVGERRRGHRKTGYSPPRVQATGPNQAWSWDIECHEALFDRAVVKGHRGWPVAAGR